MKSKSDDESNTLQLKRAGTFLSRLFENPQLCTIDINGISFPDPRNRLQSYEWESVKGVEFFFSEGNYAFLFIFRDGKHFYFNADMKTAGELLPTLTFVRGVYSGPIVFREHNLFDRVLIELARDLKRFELDPIDWDFDFSDPLNLSLDDEIVLDELNRLTPIPVIRLFSRVNTHDVLIGSAAPIKTDEGVAYRWEKLGKMQSASNGN